MGRDLSADRVLRGARVREVVEVEFLLGAGVDADPIRVVLRYYAPDGTLLAEHDDWAEGA